MIDFLKYRYFCYTFSVAILILGVVLYFVKGGFNYGIDFVGGAEIRVSFENKIDITQLRDIVTKKGWKDPMIQMVGSESKEFIVRVGGSIENLEEKFKSDISAELPSNKMTIENIDMVGAEVGKDMQWNAFIAVLLSVLALLLYLVFRSKLSYAVGAVVALVHDVSIVLAILLLIGEPITLSILSAILAILGYSINDTIIIFGRIRENMAKMRGTDPVELVNVSINQTLSRTLRTSLATLLAVLSFYFLGGETLSGFSLVMIIGIIFGTYSSIYVASPIMLAVRSMLKTAE